MRRRDSRVASMNIFKKAWRVLSCQDAIDRLMEAGVKKVPADTAKDRKAGKRSLDVKSMGATRKERKP